MKTYKLEPNDGFELSQLEFYDGEAIRHANEKLFKIRFLVR